MSERLTRHQAAVIGAYTGVLCGDFADLQEYAENLMGMPIWTHEFGRQEFADELKELARDDFLALCNEGSN